MDNTKHSKLLKEYEDKYQAKEITTKPKAFIEGLKTGLINNKIDIENLVEIHQQLYLYYYKEIENKYRDLVKFFKDPKNNDFRDTLYKIRNNDDFNKDIEPLQTNLNKLYDPKNTLKIAIDNFLNNVKKSFFYIENIINIFKLYNNQPIDIKFIKPKINNEINDESERQLETSYLDSNYTTEKSFLKTISRIESDIRSGINITSISGQKGIKNQKKQLLYFCQLFIEIQDNNYQNNNDIISLKNSYDDLITILNDHISNFVKNVEIQDYKITSSSDFIINYIGIRYNNTINHIDELNKLRKYILNESLIDQLIKEYNTYFSSMNKKKLKEQKEAKEFKEVIKSEIKANKKEFTDLIPLTRIKQIGQIGTSTLSTSLDKVQSKGLDYLDTVIKIIIFLIFLNLFITTYFYFTTSIEATANRSNCGGASLCEAETHRHLFLEDNGNDKARDIYIIIVVIFSIYLLSEIFKNSKDGINFDDDNNNISVPIAVLCGYFVFIVGTISGIIYNTTPKPSDINLASSIAFIFYLLIIGIIFLYHYIVKKDDALDNIITKVLTVVIALATIILEIVILAKGSEFDLFIGFSEDGSGLLNPNFNANTALHLIFLVFYLTFFIVVFTFNKDIKSLHIWGLVFLAFILFTLFIFILLASLDFKNTEYTYHLQNIKHSTSSMQYFVLILPLVCLWCFRSELKNAIKLIVLYYAILFIIYLFYVYFVNHSNETGILSLESFQLYNWESEDKNEKIKGSKEELNYKKELNKANTGFVFILLIILIVIGGLNDNPNLDNIIYGIIVFIIASYITGIVYLLYNKVFPIQQASFNYKKNLVDINNEISQHIKVELEEHTIDKNKIRIFKIANDAKDIENIHTRIKQQRNDGTKDKEMHMKNIRDIFSEISPKGSSYEDYRSQSTDQMQYEEYIYRLFSVWQGDNMFEFNTNYSETIFAGEVITTNQHKVYNNIITKLPKNKDDLGDLELTPANKDTLLAKPDFIKDLFKIPVTNNIEYVIKKNYKYVTGEEGVIQKYNSDSKMSQDIKNAFYWIKLQISNKKGFHYDNTYFGASNEQSEYTPHTDNNWYRVADGGNNEKREFFSAFRYDKIFSETDVITYKKLGALHSTFFIDRNTENNINTDLFNRNDLTTLSDNKIKQELEKIKEDISSVNSITASTQTQPESRKAETDKINNNTTLLALVRFYLKLEENSNYYINKPDVKPSPGDHDNDDEIRNMLSNSSQADIFEEIRLSSEDLKKIGITHNILYKMKISEFNKIKEKVKDEYRVYFMVFEDKQSKQINCYVSYNITNPDPKIRIIENDQSIDIIKTIQQSITETDTSITKLQAYIEKTDPVLAPFYTIGYDYENYTENHQQMNKDTAYSIPARYYACSYLNYFPNEDGSMSKVKFAKNIKEDNYNPLNTKNTIVDRIAKSYNANAKATKIELAPEKFQFLLVFLVILAIIILMFLFNIIKKYFTGDVYTPQMYVLGILGVFLTTFIFGEVIFARIK